MRKLLLAILATGATGLIATAVHAALLTSTGAGVVDTIPATLDAADPVSGPLAIALLGTGLLLLGLMRHPRIASATR